MQRALLRCGEGTEETARSSALLRLCPATCTALVASLAALARLHWTYLANRAYFLATRRCRLCRHVRRSVLPTEEDIRRLSEGLAASMGYTLFSTLFTPGPLAPARPSQRSIGILHR
jgi:hypothetical protein